MKKMLSLCVGIAMMGFVGCDDATDDTGTTAGLDASRVHPRTTAGDSIPVEKVPMFIVLGFDDNGIADSANNGGASWALNYLLSQTNSDGSPMSASFYFTVKYGFQDFWAYDDPANVRKVWQKIYDAGFEIGCHSFYHTMMSSDPYENYVSRAYSRDEWYSKELGPAMGGLTKGESANMFEEDSMSFPASAIVSWRTPRLEWNNALLGLLKDEGFLYDCSIENAIEGGNEGSTDYWPFTLDNGHPEYPEVSKHAGLWELPCYRLWIPTSLQSAAGGETNVSGLDYNVWVKKEWEGLELSSQDFTDILKYNLDRRRSGNKAPMLIGLHSDVYSDLYTADSSEADKMPKTANARERQLAIENFIAYAKATYPDVRVVSGKQLVEWMKNPTPLQ